MFHRKNQSMSKTMLKQRKYKQSLCIRTFLQYPQNPILLKHIFSSFYMSSNSSSQIETKISFVINFLHYVVFYFITFWGGNENNKHIFTTGQLKSSPTMKLIWYLMGILLKWFSFVRYHGTFPKCRYRL